MKAFRIAASLVVFVALLAGCGSDKASTISTTTTAAATTTTAESESTTLAETTSTMAAALSQRAIWPAVDVVFSDPTDVAADFVSKVFHIAPELGEFRQGDSRSGEIDVLSLGEGGGKAIVRSTLLLRQLDPDNGWFVQAAVNENVTISSPEAWAEVAFGPTEVVGRGRGFEGALVVEAFLAGDASVRLSENVVQGGSGADPEPYSAVVVLQGLESGGVLNPGDTVLLLVRAGTGLETDPGEFSAIGVTIA